MRRRIIFPLLLAIMACQAPQGLEPVPGVQGKVFITAWGDSVQGAAVVVFDHLDPEHLAQHFISFSNPVPAGTDSAEYFIQLKPGGYALVVVGITVDPAFLVTHLDSLLQAPQLPIVVPELNAATLKTALVRSGEVTTVDDMVVSF